MSNLDERTLVSSLQTRDEREKNGVSRKDERGDISRLSSLVSPLLQTDNLRRVFSETGESLEILKGVNFSMDAGELVALTGSSGSGKSTFLNLVDFCKGVSYGFEENEKNVVLDSIGAAPLQNDNRKVVTLEPRSGDRVHDSSLGMR